MYAARQFLRKQVNYFSCNIIFAQIIQYHSGLQVDQLRRPHRKLFFPESEIYSANWGRHIARIIMLAHVRNSCNISVNALKGAQPRKRDACVEPFWCRVLVILNPNPYVGHKRLRAINVIRLESLLGGPKWGLVRPQPVGQGVEVTTGAVGIEQPVPPVGTREGIERVPVDDGLYSIHEGPELALERVILRGDRRISGALTSEADFAQDDAVAPRENSFEGGVEVTAFKALVRRVGTKRLRTESPEFCQQRWKRGTGGQGHALRLKHLNVVYLHCESDWEPGVTQSRLFHCLEPHSGPVHVSADPVPNAAGPLARCPRLGAASELERATAVDLVVPLPVEDCERDVRPLFEAGRQKVE